MREKIWIVIFTGLFAAEFLAAQGQPVISANFEVASIKANAPQPGFHFAADAAFGGPGTADPGMFRCSKCSLATLITKAFNLQPYQFPNRTALARETYDIQAKIPAGATPEEFLAMLQNLLKDRFGLAWHFQEKMVKGYRLVVAKGGSKLEESTGISRTAVPDQHRSGQGESHNHTGVLSFGGSSMYRAANQTLADLVRVLSDQIGLPVEDQTGLTGKYEISLRWSDPTLTGTSNHSEGAFSAGAEHAGHAAGGAGGPGSSPALFDALQQQLGLRLIPAERTLSRLFFVDSVTQHPTEN